MTAYRLNLSTDKTPSVCGQIGGSPHLPVSTDWPRCRMCDAELVAFLELVLPKCPTSPFQAGSRLQIFACREHDDITGTAYSDYSRFETASRNSKLPPEYWNINDGHYVVRLLPPAAKVQQAKPEPRLARQFVIATATDSDAEAGFKLFGDPDWFQDPEHHTCSCGAPMKLLLQVPENQGFAMAAEAERQPNSYGSEYHLFLGNQLYLLGCTAQCDPRALWPVLQN